MNETLPRAETTLLDKYMNQEGWVYMTGMQALVRLPVQQRLRDQAVGWNTGGYISGYRGSPMGRYDMELLASEKLLEEHNIQFRPGLNEDLAATAIWGSQYVGSFQGAKVDGVFGIWYGKGPGVDRSGDVLRHANLAGTSPKGGVVCLAGDDHGAKSSSVANFSDQLFIATGIPVLYPSNTQEVLEYGLHGIAMSRYSGCWVGLKLVTDVVEGGGSVFLSPDTPRIVRPNPPEAEADSNNIRPIDSPLQQEHRLYHQKLRAVLDYARVNGMNEIMPGGDSAKIGIVSAGKSWQDVQQAMTRLEGVEAHGVRMLKVGMVWPLDSGIVREFARGLEKIIVVEEKRPILEDQIRTALYGGAEMPRIIGKHDTAGAFDVGCGPMVFPNSGELNPERIAAVLTELLGVGDFLDAPGCADLPLVKSDVVTLPKRVAGFCSGCPHSRSTKLPNGSRALAGIGCHSIAMFRNPAETTTISHMGGEGVMWLGQHAFTNEKHVFANLGDGTFAHSGFLAVRQAIAAGVPITYKILYNGFVSMTGGQAVETGQSPAQILHGLAAEGLKKMAIVTDDVGKYASVELPKHTSVHNRAELNSVQKEFREYPGVSVILYDQPCATERRRLRKRGKYVDPQKRTFINPAVCEGCGDCGKASGCMSIEPLETDLGRKRKINQSSCNKDYSCVDGFCPSFVTVHGGKLRAPRVNNGKLPSPQWTLDLPDPKLPVLSDVCSVLVSGIGGTGVVTIGQTLAMAAHLEGFYSSNLDVTGLSQKYGAVNSHVRFAPQREMLHATRISTGETNTLIACDLIAAASDETIATLQKNWSRGVVCADLIPTVEFTDNPDWKVDRDTLLEHLRSKLGESVTFIDGQSLAKGLLGDPIGANMLMLGMAWQLGLLPLSHSAIIRAIELNGVAVAMNKDAFLWGRRAAHDPRSVERFLEESGSSSQQVIHFLPRAKRSLDEIVKFRVDHLRKHSGHAAVARYQNLVKRVRMAEEDAKLGDVFSRAVAVSYHKLLAVKDEWEVARLYSDSAFLKMVEEEFEGDYKLHFHVGAWPFAKKQSDGRIAKSEVGPWLMTAFRWMSKLRFLRGTLLDPFRNTEERRLDKHLVVEFESDVARLIAKLGPDNHMIAAKIAGLPDSIRGYGHVKETNAAKAAATRSALLEQLVASSEEAQLKVMNVS